MILYKESLTRYRYPASSTGTVDDAGVFTPASPTSSTFRGSVQPHPGVTSKTETDGWRRKKAVTIFTKTELKIADQTAGGIADRVVYRGHTYEVVEVAEWPVSTLAHFQVTAVLLEETLEAP